MFRHMTTFVVVLALGMHSVWGCGVCRHQAHGWNNHDGHHGRLSPHHAPADQHAPCGDHQPHEHPQLPGETCVFVKKLSPGDELRDPALRPNWDMTSPAALVEGECDIGNPCSLDQSLLSHRQTAPVLAQLCTFLL